MFTFREVLSGLPNTLKPTRRSGDRGKQLSVSLVSFDLIGDRAGCSCLTVSDSIQKDYRRFLETKRHKDESGKDSASCFSTDRASPLFFSGQATEHKNPAFGKTFA